MPSAFTWSDSDRFSISSSSVCFLSWRSFALPSMFRSSARSLHALPRLHPFLLQRLKFLLPGLSFCISMLRDVFFGGHPTPMPRTSAQIVRISMASSDVVLILFPVEWSYQSNTIWAWRFGFHTSPANAPRPYGWQSVQVSPRTSLLESFPKFLQFFHGRILFDHDHALTGEVPP